MRMRRFTADTITRKSEAVGTAPGLGGGPDQGDEFAGLVELTGRRESDDHEPATPQRLARRLLAG